MSDPAPAGPYASCVSAAPTMEVDGVEPVVGLREQALAHGTGLYAGLGRGCRLRITAMTPLRRSG